MAINGIGSSAAIAIIQSVNQAQQTTPQVVIGDIDKRVQAHNQKFVQHIQALQETPNTGNPKGTIIGVNIDIFA